VVLVHRAGHRSRRLIRITSSVIRVELPHPRPHGSCRSCRRLFRIRKFSTEHAILRETRHPRQGRVGKNQMSPRWPTMHFSPARWSPSCGLTTGGSRAPTAPTPRSASSRTRPCHIHRNRHGQAERHHGQDSTRAHAHCLPPRRLRQSLRLSSSHAGTGYPITLRSSSFRAFGRPSTPRQPTRQWPPQ
jgi:hypothetical protein